MSSSSSDFINIPPLRIHLLGLKDDFLKENTLIPERRILAPNTSVDFDIVVEAPTQTVKRIHAFLCHHNIDF